MTARRWWVIYGLVVVVGFGSLYLSTRSRVLIGDGGFIEYARSGDPAGMHYGEPNHFLQGPLARALWIASARLGWTVELEAISLALSLMGMLVAAVAIGGIAATLLGDRFAAWTAAGLFGGSLYATTQWNGELYALGLGALNVGLWLALRGRVVVPATLWATAVLAHSDLSMAGPVFLLAVWFGRPAGADWVTAGRRGLLLLAVAGGVTAVVMLTGTWLIGKWSDASSLVGWLQASYGARTQDIAPTPEVVRAAKGLLTAFTVAGHWLRDMLTGRMPAAGSGFVSWAIAGAVVVAIAIGGVVASVRHRRACLFGLVWLLPFHTLVNWWFVPTVEKYHGGAIPAFVLLVAVGLHSLARRSGRVGPWLLALVVVGAGALNILGAVLPMRQLGVRVDEAAQALRAVPGADEGRAVLIACDDPKAVRESGLRWIRLRSLWRGTGDDVRTAIVTTLRAELQAGRQPYLVGRVCLPEEWRTPGPRDRFDLYFLSDHFTLTPTDLRGIPVTESVPTNPFNWITGDVTRVDAR